MRKWGETLPSSCQHQTRLRVQCLAAWCSLKIIRLSLGLFLLVESIGALFAIWKFKTVALLVYFFAGGACLGFLFGSYYLLKALL